MIPSAGDARPGWTLDDFKGAVGQARQGKVAVLQFHGVPDTAHDWVTSSRRQFEAYLKYLADHKFRVIALRDLEKYVDPTVVPEPIKIVHTAGLTILLQEEYQHFRQIFTDGRAFPADMQPAWYGYSVGRWEGEEFVIETAGFNNQGWLDLTPLTHSESLRTIERFRRPNVGSLQVQATINDPSKFSRVWKTQTISFRLVADADLVEYLCDNNIRLLPAAQ